MFGEHVQKCYHILVDSVSGILHQCKDAVDNGSTGIVWKKCIYQMRQEEITTHRIVKAWSEILL